MLHICRLILVWVIAQATVCSSAVIAQCATWTHDFGFPGTNGGVLDAITYDDGTGPALYIAGGFTAVGATSANCVARSY